MNLYRNCLLCPRRCGVDRNAGETGYCGETEELRIASASIHRGEEPPITGRGGSGTIFITGCNLGCVFCQNYQISRRALGRAVDCGEFADICLALRDRGAENINIVTGSHAAPAVITGIENARRRDLDVPLLWNSSGYEGMETLAVLKDHVDMYLPDLKTLDSGTGRKFFNAPDYPQYAAAAILKMMEYNKDVMIRHLVLPGCLDGTRGVLRWFSENCQNRNSRGCGHVQLSLMTQYTPVRGTDTPENGPPRFVSPGEYETVLGWLDEFGIDDGFCQELAAGSEWLPDFNRTNPFSSDLSVPVWHWREGMLNP
jgi:putative pyruvate formate lyase activating enzyme